MYLSVLHSHFAHFDAYIVILTIRKIETVFKDSKVSTLQFLLKTSQITQSRTLPNYILIPVFV